MSSIDKKIEAVEYLLASFFIHSNDEAEREKAVREKCDENNAVAIYARMSEEKLTEQLVILNSKFGSKC